MALPLFLVDDSRLEYLLQIEKRAVTRCTRGSQHLAKESAGVGLTIGKKGEKGAVDTRHSVGLDTTPPAHVSAFTATSGDGHVILSWTNPADSDFAGNMIRYRTDGTHPTDHTDGTLVCDRSAAPGSEDSFTHTEGVENDITYYYSAFTYDEVPNYSETAHASATPTASGPPLDTIDPTIGITSPTAGDSYVTDEETITLGGSASDDVGVASVTWTNSRGSSGTASGTTDWTISNLPLHCGDDNIITVTAKDGVNNTATDTLTVDVKPCSVSGFHQQ